MTTHPEPIRIYTDGACRGNPGPGGWGALLRYRGHEKTLYGGEAETKCDRQTVMTIHDEQRVLLDCYRCGPSARAQDLGLKRIHPVVVHLFCWDQTYW